MTEPPLTKRIMLVLASQMPNARIFRNNTGMGWAGRLISNIAGKVTLQDARPLHAGLCEGSSDLIGWTSVEITPEMVGKNVAVFTAIEVKQTGKRPTDKQANFLNRVRHAGGIGIVASDPGKSAGDMKILVESLRK